MSSNKLPIFPNFEKLRKTVIQCTLCPRLVAYRESVPPRAAFRDETFWRRPVPGFGDPQAWLLVLGLAPAAQGGNRTGRVFTGDETGRFLYQALYDCGFSNQPTGNYANDGLELYGCYLTAAVKCAPPDNKPTKDEFSNCSNYFHNEIRLLSNLQAVLVLGKLAFDSYIAYAKSQGCNTRGMRFFHGACYQLENLPKLYCSYHPSQRNVFTKTLTEAMFLKVLEKIKKDKQD